MGEAYSDARTGKVQRGMKYSPADQKVHDRVVADFDTTFLPQEKAVFLGAGRGAEKGAIPRNWDSTTTPCSGRSESREAVPGIQGAEYHSRSASADIGRLDGFR